MELGISVIICCFNSALRLPRTLEHLAKQKTDHLKWEIVLVDNASSDDTRTTSEKLWRSFNRQEVSFRVVVQPKPGLSFAREKGVEASAFETIVFCDDDNWLAEDYLVEAYKIISENTKIGALGGTGTAVADKVLPDWFEKYKYNYACFPQAVRDGELDAPTASLYGAGLVVNKKALKELKAKNFEPLLSDRTGSALASGGDTELSFAIRLLGYQLWFSGRLKFKHYMPPGRLTEAYLIHLNKSLAYCSGKLIVYHYALQGKRATDFTWLKDSCYQLFLWVKTLVKYSGARAMPAFERTMLLDFSNYRLKSFLEQAGRYKKLYNRMMLLRS